MRKSVFSISRLNDCEIKVLYSLYSSFISQSFNLEILNTDFLTKFWRHYLQSLQRLSTRVGAKVFADSREKSLQTLEVITIQTFDQSPSSNLSLKY